MVPSTDEASKNEAMQFKGSFVFINKFAVVTFCDYIIPSPFHLSGLPYFAFQHRPVKPRRGCPSLG